MKSNEETKTLTETERSLQTLRIKELKGTKDVQRKQKHAGDDRSGASEHPSRGKVALLAVVWCSGPSRRARQ